MTKEKISITLDRQILNKIKREVEKGKFANLSFAIEYYCRGALK